MLQHTLLQRESPGLVRSDGPKDFTALHRSKLQHDAPLRSASLAARFSRPTQPFLVPWEPPGQSLRVTSTCKTLKQSSAPTGSQCMHFPIAWRQRVETWPCIRLFRGSVDRHSSHECQKLIQILLAAMRSVSRQVEGFSARAWNARAEGAYE